VPNAWACCSDAQVAVQTASGTPACQSHGCEFHNSRAACRWQGCFSVSNEKCQIRGGVSGGEGKGQTERISENLTVGVHHPKWSDVKYDQPEYRLACCCLPYYMRPITNPPVVARLLRRLLPLSSELPTSGTRKRAGIATGLGAFGRFDIYPKPTPNAGLRWREEKEFARNHVRLHCGCISIPVLAPN
jgi:hypothetical protein